MGVDWIGLAEDRSMWRDILNTVMKFWVSLIRAISLLAEELEASQDGLCSLRLE
jgi:hypothetical protein